MTETDKFYFTQRRGLYKGVNTKRQKSFGGLLKAACSMYFSLFVFGVFCLFACLFGFYFLGPMDLYILYLSLLFRQKNVSIVLVQREVGIFVLAFMCWVVLGST